MGKRLLSRNHILLRKLYRNISKSEQKNQKRRFKKEDSKKKIQEVPLYKQPSNNACDTALMGEQKHSPLEG